MLWAIFLRVLLYALCTSHVQAPRRILRANRAATSDSEPPSEFQMRDLPDKQTRKKLSKITSFSVFNGCSRNYWLA